MQEKATKQQSEGYKVATTFKCSPATRARLLQKATQLDVSLSALCEDYVNAGLDGHAATATTPPADQEGRTLTDWDLEMIRAKTEEVIFDARFEAGAAKPLATEPEQQPEPEAPALKLTITEPLRALLDKVNEHRKANKLPSLEESAADILLGYAQDTWERSRFKATNGMTYEEFKKAVKDAAASSTTDKMQDATETEKTKTQE